MFMSPTLTDTSTGWAGRAGNRSALSWHTATTLLSVVTGSCGIPVKMIPVAGLPLSALPGQHLNAQNVSMALTCTQQPLPGSPFLKNPTVLG